MKNRVIVTGGFGFIGSYLTCKYLLEGYKVLVIESSKYNKSRLKMVKTFLDSFIYNPDISILLCGLTFSDSELSDIVSNNLEIVSTDLANPDKDSYDSIIRFIKKSPTKVIINHHASSVVATEVFSSEDNISGENDGKNNILSCFTLLKIINEVPGKIKTLIFASSAGAIYGDTSGNFNPDPNTYPINYSTYYGLSKYTCENYFRLNFSIERKTNKNFPSLVILRYANVIGWGISDNVVSKWFDNRVAVLYNSGLQTRTFVSVLDIAKINVLLSEKSDLGTEKIITISNSENYITLASLYQLVHDVDPDISLQIDESTSGGVLDSCITMSIQDREYLSGYPQEPLSFILSSIKTLRSNNIIRNYLR